MLLQSTNEECPELSPAHQHKVRAAAHVDVITGRGGRLSAQECPFFVCVCEVNHALCFGSKPKRSPRAQRGTI